MKKKLLIFSGMVVFVISAIISCSGNNQNTETAKPVSQDSLVKRGEYLVKIMGCDDCHSPKNMGPNGPEMDMSRRFSGFPSDRPLPPLDTNIIKKGWLAFVGDLTATAGPWGISFSANLTSDSSTGIGKWTEEQFARAITQGKYNGDEHDRMILPPMPWQNFSNLHNEDVSAIFAYLKLTHPVQNKVPAPIAFHEIKVK